MIRGQGAAVIVELSFRPSDVEIRGFGARTAASKQSSTHLLDSEFFSPSYALSSLGIIYPQQHDSWIHHHMGNISRRHHP